MPSTGIHQVLGGPRGALRLDPKHTAVVTTLGSREASPRLPPLPFRNGELVYCCVAVDGRVEWPRPHFGVLSHNDLFHFLEFPNSIGASKQCTCWTAVVNVTLFCYRYGDR